MSEVDDLMVDVMMRSESQAEDAVLRLLQIAREEGLNSEESRRVMKAVERRMVKVRPRSDLYDFMERLTELIKEQQA